MDSKIIKRSFLASKYPRGSPQRAELNQDPAHSEYRRWVKYLFVTERFGAQHAKTLAEAEEMQRIHAAE